MFRKVPISLVSLVDVDRQWFKSNSGLDSCQTHRNDSFCAYTVLPESCDVFVVPDALEDRRFHKNKLVTGSPHIRFYAGASLIVAGVKVGSLCIIDTKPRHDFNIDQRMNLLDLGEAVANLIRERREYNLRAQQDRSNLMTEMMHNIRTPLMSLIIASSILERSTSNHSTKDSDIYNNCILDVVTSVKEIQVQVENTLNMSGTFVSRELNLKGTPKTLSSKQSLTEGKSNITVENKNCELLNASTSVAGLISSDPDSLEWEENFVLPSSTINNEL